MGIILNRPGQLPFLELMRQLTLDLTPDAAAMLEPKANHPGAVLLEGGPVATEQAFVVHSAERSYQQSIALASNTMLSTDLQVLQDIAQGQGPEDFLIAQGYAGWGPGQLEGEMADDAWVALGFQEPLTMQSLFRLQPERRLKHACRRAGLDLGLVSGRIGYA